MINADENKNNIKFITKIFIRIIYGMFAIVPSIAAFILVYGYNYPICWVNSKIDSDTILIVFGIINIIFYSFNYPLIFKKLKSNSAYNNFDTIPSKYRKIMLIAMCLICFMFWIFHLAWGFMAFNIINNESDCQNNSFPIYVILYIITFIELINSALSILPIQIMYSRYNK